MGEGVQNQVGGGGPESSWGRGPRIKLREGVQDPFSGDEKFPTKNSGGGVMIMGLCYNVQKKKHFTYILHFYFYIITFICDRQSSVIIFAPL